MVRRVSVICAFTTRLGAGPPDTRFELFTSCHVVTEIGLWPGSWDRRLTEWTCHLG